VWFYSVFVEFQMEKIDRVSAFAWVTFGQPRRSDRDFDDAI